MQTKDNSKSRFEVSGKSLSKVTGGYDGGGVVAHVNPNICIACEACQLRDFCPAAAPYMKGRGSDRVCVINTDSCLGCGKCVDKCPAGAISMYWSLRRLVLAPRERAPRQHQYLQTTKNTMPKHRV